MVDTKETYATDVTAWCAADDGVGSVISASVAPLDRLDASRDEVCGALVRYHEL